MRKSANVRPLVILAVWAASSPWLGRAQPEGDVLDSLYEWGEEMVRAYVPDDFLARYHLPNAEDLTALWTALDAGLQSGSLETLAWLLPEVETALGSLESIPAAQPYVDWLRQRADYLAMADHVIRAFPVPGEPPPPSPPRGAIKPPPRPRAAPPPAQVSKRRQSAAGNQQVWKRKLAQRPVPKGADRWVPACKTVFQREGLPPQLVWLAEVESSFNPEARSPVGAAGLFQFMPATAERFGLSLQPRDQRLEPERSAQAAAKYLRVLHQRFDSWPLALAAYNAGEGRVSRTLKQRGASNFEEIADDLPTETRMYVPKIAATISLREGVELSSLPPPRT